MQLASVSKLMGSSALIFACRLGGAITVFVTQLSLARWMGAAELGIYVLAFSWCLMLSTVAGLGYPAASLRFIGETIGKNKPEQLRGFIGHSRKIVILASGAAACIAIAAIFALRATLPETYIWPLVAAMICVPLVTLQRLQDKFANAFSWFGLAFAPSMAVRPLLFLLIIAAVWQSTAQVNAATAMAWQLLAILIVVVGQFLLMRPKLRAKLGTGPAELGTRLWTRTAIPLLISTLFVQYFPELTVILLGFLLPPADVAVFYTCFRIALFIGFALTAVNALLTPQIAKLYAADDLDSLQNAVAATTRLKFLGGLAALALLTLFGKIVLSWFGPEFIPGYPILLTLAASQLLLAAIGPVDILLNLTGHQKQCLMVFSAALPVALILNLMLVPFFGAIGAAIAAFLTALFWNIWLRRIVIRTLAIQPSISI